MKIYGAIIFLCIPLYAALVKINNITDQPLRVEYPYELFGQSSTKTASVDPYQIITIDTGLSNFYFLTFITAHGRETIYPNYDKLEMWRHMITYRGPQG